MPTSWLEVLQSACEKSSQAEVARRLHVSPTVLSRVLKSQYEGNLASVKGKVEGAFMDIEVFCPGAGMKIGKNICINNQRRPFAATNPQRVRLAQVCPKCISKV